MRMRLRRNKVRVFFNSIVDTEEYSIQGDRQVEHEKFPVLSREVHFDVIEVDEQTPEKENQENVEANQVVMSKKKYDKGERKFPCSYCEKAFRCKASREEHIVTHTKESNFHCPYCIKSFRHKTNLRRHMRINHSEMESQEHSQRSLEKKISEIFYIHNPTKDSL
ncbi:zinc finger protein 786-like [Phlebotomus argentipes]|uniref:zinc finger protein 786-like n=1 Tax=Phlebotomus argentipes TaxID=94469 RepID=UPI002892E301|nr:zinc finger protein 786-like [Phlebotomus argentipes]